MKYDVRNNPIISTGGKLSRKPRDTAPVVLRLNEWIVVKSDETAKDPFWVAKVQSFTDKAMKVRWFTGCGTDIEHYQYQPAVHNQDDEPSKPLVPHYDILDYTGPEAVCILDSGRDSMTKSRALKVLTLKKIEEDDRVKFARKPRTTRKVRK